MAEQSPQANSEQQTPQEHEKAMEERVLDLIDPAHRDNDKEEEEAKPEAEAQQDSQEQPEEQKAEGEEKLPEAEDIEFEGKQYKVPPELKDALLRQSDYTRKTQEVAEAKKAAEALTQQLQKQAELQKASAKVLGKIASLDDQIAQYEKVDWNSLTAQDAGLAQRHFIQFQSLKDQKAKAEGELKTAEDQFRSEAQKVHQARLEEGLKVLQRDIKGWSPELGQKLMQFGVKNYGMSPEEVANVSDPRFVKLLHDAFQLHQTKESAQKLPEKKIAPKTPTLKPQGADSTNPQKAAYDADRRALTSAKTNSDRAKAAERLILRKLG